MKKSRASWWCMPIILALERLKQGTYWFKTILVIMLDPVTKQTNTKKHKNGTVEPFFFCIMLLKDFDSTYTHILKFEALSLLNIVSHLFLNYVLAGQPLLLVFVWCTGVYMMDQLLHFLCPKESSVSLVSYYTGESNTSIILGYYSCGVLLVRMVILTHDRYLPLLEQEITLSRSKEKTR